MVPVLEPVVVAESDTSFQPENCIDCPSHS